jgi:hypothetical protein
MQVSLHKRFSAGLEYQISYIWAHGMSDSIGYYGESGQSWSQSAYMQNLSDQRSEWSPQLADVEHNFVASYFYGLPFGRGKKFGSGSIFVERNLQRPTPDLGNLSSMPPRGEGSGETTLREAS